MESEPTGYDADAVRALTAAVIDQAAYEYAMYCEGLDGKYGQAALEFLQDCSSFGEGKMAARRINRNRNHRLCIIKAWQRRNWCRERGSRRKCRVLASNSPFVLELVQL